MVFSEALSFGMRLIVSDAGGSDLADLVGREGLGGIIRPGDIHGLAALMASFASGREVFSEKSRKKILPLFNVRKASAGLLKELRKLR